MHNIVAVSAHLLCRTVAKTVQCNLYTVQLLQQYTFNPGILTIEIRFPSNATTCPLRLRGLPPPAVTDF